ncbi:hypothetical protein ACWD0Z_32035 [Streptomyces sp. NPDC003007]
MGRDVRLLLESPLPDKLIHTVWLAAVGEHFDPTGHGIDTRTWLHEIAEVCTERAPRRPGFSTGEQPVVPEAELRESFLAEIRTASSALSRAVPERDMNMSRGSPTPTAV